MPRMSSWTELATPTVLGAAACAACCAVPLAGLVIGTGAASALATWVEPLAAVLLAGAVLTGGVVWVRRRSRNAAAAAGVGARESCGCGPALDEAAARSVGCTLEASELPARGEAFRALFDRALTRRQAFPGRVEWVLAWSPEVESEARSLAAAESGCCSFFQFEIARSGDELRWTARTPPGLEGALEMLDRIALEASPRAYAWPPTRDPSGHGPLLGRGSICVPGGLRRPVAGASRGMRLEQADAEDAAQRALLLVFSRIADLDPERDGVSWALTLASYEVLTLRKQRTRRRREAPGEALEQTGDGRSAA